MARRKKHPKSGTRATVLPSKHTDVQSTVREFVRKGLYVPTEHAKMRLDQRQVTIQEVKAVLESGKYAPRNDRFHEEDWKGQLVNRWSYAFTYKGLDKSLKVCVSIDPTAKRPLLIVTVIDLD